MCWKCRLIVPGVALVSNRERMTRGASFHTKYRVTLILLHTVLTTPKTFSIRLISWEYAGIYFGLYLFASNVAFTVEVLWIDASFQRSSPSPVNKRVPQLAGLAPMTRMWTLPCYHGNIVPCILTNFHLCRVYIILLPMHLHNLLNSYLCWIYR